MNKHPSQNGSRSYKDQKFYVRFMVSIRCKMVLKSELETMKLKYAFTTNGAIRFPEITDLQLDLLKARLLPSGLVLLNHSNSLLIDNILCLIIEKIHYSDSLPNVSFKEIIHENTSFGSESILKIFSDVMGISVLHYIVQQKIERAKEMLLYENLSIDDIATILYYKNSATFRVQFIKFTGLTPDDYKNLQQDRIRLSRKDVKEPWF